MRITDVRYGPDFSAPRHEHEHDCATIVLEGALAKESRRCDRALRVGGVAVTPAGMPHTDRFGAEGGRTLVVEVLRESDGGWSLPRFHESDRAHSPRAHVLGMRLAAELRATDDAAPLALHGAALELVATLSRAQAHAARRPPRWLGDVTEWLRVHAFEKVTLAELAAVAGVHRTHLVRVFREWHGMSVGAYLRGLRIEWAAEALLAEDASIAEIAARAGFADQSHFTRTFVQRFGVSPGRYRAGATKPA